MKTSVSIISIGSVSALGSNHSEIWSRYLQNSHLLQKSDFGKVSAWAGFLPQEIKTEINNLRSQFRKVDDSVLYAIYATRLAMERAGWERGEDIGINIGSSRGATTLFEEHFTEYLKTGKAQTLSSPNTTLGNISSWVAQDLKSRGPEISHSVTCSTALHAVINGIAWLSAGMAKKFISGGSEAALTPFTMAQMAAMKVIASKERPYPCRALDLQKRQNSMVLGEGAAVVCLEAGERRDALAQIIGIGYATEELDHPASISASGNAFQQAMRMALGNISPEEVDVVVMHAPGTVKGDLSEMAAVKAIFGEELPALTTNKWKVGHTFGASGTLSLELAVLMLQQQIFIPVPFLSEEKLPQKLEKILINAVGFGGNAVSILIERSL
ncbi:3-oxoacyl-(acyl-carrier-protein) synthase [Salinimicrobium sediminis]|uniref:3-oxoacyl-(Acyl-carrier-protein) synthase n=1 Tax=Salinimicrobium sediminis TaxID=1343891 RepID=A0A285X137_9FLAO|nr:beta-ketoacyl synthase N-terminal-like domain-containing protein [Salinimicrobium sediminis]SOC79081.1 3-oxoacyl-(acyl-carrier-protein) synthase [Salinimicrobium sediminis]